MVHVIGCLFGFSGPFLLTCAEHSGARALLCSTSAVDLWVLRKKLVPPAPRVRAKLHP